MSYLEHEPIYRELIASFLARSISADEFVTQYFTQWRKDRDAQWTKIKDGHELTSEERSLSNVLDPIFTACDVYSPSPEGEFEISDEQLAKEVRNYADARWSPAA